jgi:hypothetical protein
VTSIGGPLSFVHNTVLTSLTGLDNLTSIGRLGINSNYALISLTALGNVTSIGGYISIGHNDALTNLIGLEGLTSIGGGIHIQANNALISLTGLDNVTSIGDNIHIEYNDALTSLTGLDNLTSIEGYLNIEYNDALTSLTALEGLASIGGYLFIRENDSLISLSGIDNIAAASIMRLYIYSNISLSSCEVLSICNYLANPGGEIEIHDNATGCNSQDEVEEACIGVSVPNHNAEYDFSIYPNPTKGILNITYNNGAAIDEIIIYNQMGQKVFKGAVDNNTIDVSKLQQGMYVIEIRTSEFRIREKLIVND